MLKLEKKPIVVLLPAFNETKTIRDVVSGALKHCNDVIVVDDGSTDGTLEKISDLPITALCNSMNLGKDATLIRGFAYAEKFNGKGIITMDTDSQHDPDDLPKFMRIINRYPRHVIIGARVIDRKKNAPFKNRFANDLADFLISWAANQSIVDSQSGFRYYPTDFLKNYLHKANRKKHFTFESTSLIDAPRAGFPVISIPIKSCYPKDARPSHFRPVKDAWNIGAVVFKRIIKSGFCIPGLFKALLSVKTSLVKID